MAYTKDNAQKDLIEILKTNKIEMELNLYDPEPNTCCESIVNSFENIINDLSLKLYEKKYINKTFRCFIFLCDKTKRGYLYNNGSIINLCKPEPTYCLILGLGLLNAIIDLPSTITKLYKSDRKINIKPNITTDNIGIDSSEFKFNNIDILIRNIMLSIIIFHEIGHVLCGHQIPQAEGINNGTDNNNNDKAEEYWADYFSFIASFYFTLNQWNNIDKFELSYDYLIACSMLWSLYSERDNPIYIFNGDKSNHAHPLTRMWYMTPWIYPEITKIGIKPHKRLILISKYRLLLNSIHWNDLKRKTKTSNFEDRTACFGEKLKQYELIEYSEFKKNINSISKSYCKTSFYNYTDTCSQKEIISKSICDCFSINSIDCIDSRP